MAESEQVTLHCWFDRYVNRFRNRAGDLPPMLELKRSHSLRVAGNARHLAATLRLSDAEQRLAEGAGLLHDVGRFSQFAQYGSFRDAETVNHGVEGRRILEAQEAFSLFDAGEWGRLLWAVEYHNRKQVDIPGGLGGGPDRLLCLIRDADKLDVMEIVLQSIAADGFQDLPDMLPHIGLERKVSPDVLMDAIKTKSVTIEHLATLSDLLVMMATWFYDLNYPTTRRLAEERDVLMRIRRELPDVKGVDELFAGIAEEDTQRKEAAEG